MASFIHSVDKYIMSASTPLHKKQKQKHKHCSLRKQETAWCKVMLGRRAGTRPGRTLKAVLQFIFLLQQT